MTKIKKANWLDRLKDKLAMFIIRRTRVRYGPLMLEVMGEWFLIDTYGTIWRLQYTGDPSNPIIITMLYKS